MTTYSGPPVLISLKPRYTELIFQGAKKVELRRGDMAWMQERDVFIYVTRPVMQLQGGFHVGETLTGKPQEIWNEVSEYAGIEESDFVAYYAGREVACALRIKRFWEYRKPRPLDQLRRQFADFVVPQSWRYLKPSEHESFRRMSVRADRTAGGHGVAATAGP